MPVFLSSRTPPPAAAPAAPLAMALLLHGGCASKAPDDGAGGSPPTDRSAPADTGDAAPGDGGAADGGAADGGAADGGAADGGAADGGAADLDAGELTTLLIGTWQPVSMNDSGTERPLPDDPATYLLLEDTGAIAFGCGSAPFGTWEAVARGSAPGGGVIQVSFGETQLTWTIVSLDEAAFTFAEGGDSFTHQRSACP